MYCRNISLKTRKKLHHILTDTEELEEITHLYPKSVQESYHCVDETLDLNLVTRVEPNTTLR